MCGRYRRKSDKQRIVNAFEVSVGLDEIDRAPEDDIVRGSVQLVVSVTRRRRTPDRTHAMGFNLPDRLLFNARSEGIETSRFWRDAFLTGRVIVPVDGIFEWKEMPKGKRNRNTNSPCLVRNP